jgi:hypothetical protein
MKLVDDIKKGWALKCWKWFSMQAMAVATAIQGTWAWLDTDQRASIPYGSIVVPALTATVLVLGMFGRLYKQTPTGEAPKP